MNNFPPIDWKDLYEMGISRETSLHLHEGVVTATPEINSLLLRLLRDAVLNPPPTHNNIMYLRHIRDILIALTDWTQVTDSPLTSEQRSAWAVYRQNLRDLPQTYSGDGNIPWPALPE